VLALANAPDGARLAFAQLQLSARARLGSRALEVGGFNRPRQADELVVYTPEFHRTSLTGPQGAEVAVEDGRIREIADSVGSLEIPDTGFVLSATGTTRDGLLRLARRGGRVSLEVSSRAEPAFGFTPEAIVGGGPLLVRGARPVPREPDAPYAETFWSARHPRTAVGVRADGTILLVVVDGRQPQRSVGMTIEELQALMLELGASSALNLDGGGSSTLVLGGEVLNSPSDVTGDRPVSDALLVFPRG
jgi:hypothetical protein